MTIHRMPMTKGRIHLGDVAKRAHNYNEYFILEKDGIPVIGIMSADEMEDYLEIHNPKVKEKIKNSNVDVARGKTRSAKEFIEKTSSKKYKTSVL